jgi:hypothetical protein
LVDLPPLLAGPIVRRVEPRLASVWVATSLPCNVRLRIWPGIVGAGTGPGIFEQGGAVAAGERHTVRVGRRLHVAVVIARPPDTQSLNPGTRYSYNVTLQPDGGGDPHDPKSLGLLEDRPAQPALGYQAGLLPSFATCPLSIEDLMITHGSCVAPRADGPSAFFVLDELIAEHHDDPLRRPHQLFLTGDQIYADEVSVAHLYALNLLARDLIGMPEILLIGPGPALFPIPIHNHNLPPGYRRRLVTRGQAGDDLLLTTKEGHSHLLGLGELCAMYLQTWSPDVWERKEDSSVDLLPAQGLLPGLDAPLVDALEEPAPSMNPGDVGAAQTLLKTLTALDDEKTLEKKLRKKADHEREQVLRYASRVGNVRRALANVSTYMMFDDHDVTDDWNLCGEWVRRVQESDLGRSVCRDSLVAYMLMQGWGNDPAAYEQPPKAELLTLVEQLFPEPDAGREAEGPHPTPVGRLNTLFGLDPGSRSTVDWHYQVDGATHRVLVLDTRTRRTFGSDRTPPRALPDGVREQQVPEGPLPAGFEVLFAVVGQPLVDSTLLGEFTQGTISHSLEAIARIHHRLEKPDDDLEPLTFMDYEGWSTRPLEAEKMLARLAGYRRVVILSGDVHHSVSFKVEYWRRTAGTGIALVSEMAQLTCSAIRQAMFENQIIPLTGLVWVARLTRVGYPIERLGWLDPPEDPVTAPELPHRGLRRRMMLRPVSLPTTGWPEDAMVRGDTPPDFAWRADLIEDKRPNSERPESVRPPPLAAEFDADNPLDGPDGYAALARRHAGSVRRHTATRRMLAFNNIGRITFERDANGDLEVVNELRSVHPTEEPPGPPQPYTVVRVRFDAPATTPEPTIPPDPTIPR